MTMSSPRSIAAMGASDAAPETCSEPAAKACVETSEPRIRRISTSSFCWLKKPYFEATQSGPKPNVFATTLARSLTDS